MNDVAELFKVVGGLNTVTLTSLILKFWSVGWGSINSSYIQVGRYINFPLYILLAVSQKVGWRAQFVYKK